ncbi:MAG: ABC transporter substrate-binding protein [Pseudomonadota bacterium]|nr:ABC transporter substrate-binding protein [Pseudomonadota bacterium]
MLKKKLFTIREFFQTLLFFLFISNAIANDHQKTLRIGSLQYGSVNWELKLIKELELDKQNEFNLKIVELASKNAAAVALQGGAVDLIVTDWFWVSRQRSENRFFVFVPHSMAAGGIIVSKDSGIKNEKDLSGKKIGIAGGQVDKNWLILRAFYKKQHGKELKDVTKQIFGAPPLLNKKIQQKSFDAILTYWPYQAKLLVKEKFVKILNVKDILTKLNLPEGIPVIGWVFKEKWGKKNQDLLTKFLLTSKEAKKLMLESNKVWEKIRPNMNVDDDNELFISLRENYREGIPSKNFTESQIEGSKKLYSILSEIGGKDLVGKAKQLSPGTFWTK